MDVVAHRGLHSIAPENSLAAIRSALAAGFGRIEVDVRATRDGELFLLHDATLDRVTDASGRLTELSAEAAARVRLRDGSRLPTLASALALCQGRATLCLDVKELAALPRLTSLLRSNEQEAEVWSAERFVVRSAGAHNVYSALISSGVMPRGPGAFLWDAQDAGARAVSFFPADIEPHVAAACRNAAMPFMSGTPNDRATWRFLLQAGARAVITDRPISCRRWLSGAHAPTR